MPMVRRPVTPWRVAKRCIMFLMLLCIIPVVLVLLVTTDQYMKSLSQRSMFHLTENHLHTRPQKTVQQHPNKTEIRADSMDESSNKNYMELINMTAIGERMVARKTHLMDACHKLGLDIPGDDPLHKPNSWEFLVSKQYKIIWCNVFKAASTSWMYNFNLMAGYRPQFLKKTKLVPLVLARKKYPRVSVKELLTAMNDSTTFIIVRHPFERLLSAYRDKFEFHLPWTFHQKLGNKIISKYRTGGKKNPRWPRFEEFVRYLLDVYNNEHEMDMHWTPITKFCTPCMLNFDIIVNFDTLEEDQVYLIKSTHLENIVKPEWKNKGKGRNTKHLVTNYYSQLSRTQILKLYDIYRYDFQLFNYTLDGYLELGKPDATEKVK